MMKDLDGFTSSFLVKNVGD